MHCRRRMHLGLPPRGRPCWRYPTLQADRSHRVPQDPALATKSLPMNQSQQSRRYYQPVPRLWWLGRRSYILYVLRELSCVFITWFVVYLLLLISAINAGEHRYQQFLSAGANPWLLLLNMIALVFVVLHTITWFNQVPQIVIIRRHGQRVPRQVIVTFTYLLWTVLSTMVAWIVLG